MNTRRIRRHIPTGRLCTYEGGAGVYLILKPLGGTDDSTMIWSLWQDLEFVN